MDVDNEKVTRTVKVPMRHNAGDMDGLTALLLKAANAPVLGAPRIVRVVTRVISACDGKIDFQIWGDNVWRASMVHIGGSAVDRESAAGGTPVTSIRVLPDMRGVVASIDISKIPIRRGRESMLTVWTPDGRDTAMIAFSHELQDDNTCQKPSVVVRANPGKPSVSEVRPGRVFACAGTVKFQLLGDNLIANAHINVGGKNPPSATDFLPPRRILVTV